MLFNKKTALLLSSSILVSVIGACSSNVIPMARPINGDISFANSNLVTRISENVTQSKQDPNHFYIDAGNGQKTGASFTIKLNFGSDGFKTKSNSGTVASVVGDISHIDVALIKKATSPNLPADMTTPIVTGHLVRTIAGSTIAAPTTPAVNGTNGTGTVGAGALVNVITFTNVPDGTFWVAAAAVSGGTTNITSTVSPSISAATPGAVPATIVNGNYFVSTGGGDGGLLGSVTITKDVVSLKAQYVMSAAAIAAPLTLTLPLLSAGGAVITSDVTVNDGNHVLTGVPAVI